MFGGAGNAFSRQALRDAALRTKPAGQNVTAEDRQQWKQATVAFLKRARVDDEEESKAKAQKLFHTIERKAAYDHTVAMDTYLQSLGFDGWRSFVPKAGDDELPADQLHTIVTIEDQGSDVQSSLWHRIFQLQTRELHIDDPWHLIWNCVKGCATDSGLMPAIWMTSIAHNLAFGCYNGGKWYQEICESALELHAISDSQDVVFRRLLPKICKEQGIEYDASEEQATEVWQTLFECHFLKAKGPRTAPCRFFSWVQSHTKWRKEWTQRLVFLSVIGIYEGWLREADGANLVDTAMSAAVAQNAEERGEVDNTPVLKSKLDTQKLRDKCKNSVHLATKIHMDETWQFKSNVLLYAAEPLYEWYRQGTMSCRSRAASAEFFQGICTGRSWLSQLLDITNVHRDMQEMDRMGFIIEELASDVRFRAMQVDNAWVIEQDEKAATLGKVVTNMVKKRVLNLMGYMFAPPWCFALLLDAAHRVPTLQRLKLIDEAWAAVKDLKTAFWKRFRDRSCMKFQLTIDVMQRLRAAQFERVPPDLERLLARLFQNFTSTKVTEDYFQRCADRSTDRNDGIMSNASIWAQALEKKVLEELYHYKEVSADDIDDEKCTKNTLPKNVYVPNYKNASMQAEFQTLPGRGRPSWPTYAPASQPLFSEQLGLMLHLQKIGQLRDGTARSWRSALLQPGMLVRHKPSKEWCFVVAAQTCCALLLLAKSGKVGKSTFWKYDPGLSASSFRWLPVLWFTEWEVMPTKQVSPLHIFIENGRRLPATWPETNIMQCGTPQPLLNYAAKHGFFNLTAAFVRRICKDENEVEVHTDTSDAQILVTGVSSTLKCTAQEATEVLESRVPTQEGLSALEILTTKEAEECMTDKDSKELDEFVGTTQKRVEIGNDFAASLRDIRSTIRARKPKRKPVPFTSKSTYSREEVLALAPPSSNVLWDPFNGRWRLWYGPRRDFSISRSWGAAGDDEPCVRDILKAAWQRHEYLTGEPCHVTGL